MDAPVLIRTYDAPPVDIRAMLAFAGVRKDSPEVSQLLTETLEEVQGALSYAVCFCELPLTIAEGTVMFGDTCVDSHDLAVALRGCERVVLFAATVGHTIDRLIARYGKVAPSRALLLQAIGAERVEALCNRFCDELAKEARARGLATRPRFSPGYGDLSLELQRELFRILDCPRRIGLSLNQSLLMSPTKSVTALVGLFPQEREDI